MKGPIAGWSIDRETRAALLARFPPRYQRVVADHVTHGRIADAPPLPAVDDAIVIGRADDGTGVEALVVALGGSSARWDGSHYHMTWSLEPGREARESNAAIATHGWTAIDDGPAVALTRAEWP